MELTLSAAAKATGKSKSTINRAIKGGRVSARRDEWGVYHIEPSELARAFGWNPDAPVPRRTTDPQEPAPEPSVAEAVLEAKVALLEQALDREREALAHERETTADLRGRLDRADERVRALLAQAAPTSAPTPARGLLARLLGR